MFQTPVCGSCPLRTHCVAYHRSAKQQGKSSIANHFTKCEEKQVAEEASAIPDIECCK